MAKFSPHGGNIKTLMKSDQVRQRALKPIAEKLAPIVAAMTPAGSGPEGGGTRASTRVDANGHMSSKGDRVAVRVVQTAYTGRNRPRGGAALPLQYGNAITTQRNQFGKALASLNMK